MKLTLNKIQKSSTDYLKSEYGALQVNVLLSVLPPSEDFDGLITELEDNNLFF